jgi:hypothetical protein
MHRLLRRLLGMGPSPAEQHRVMLEHLSRQMIEGFTEGLRDPRPLKPEETTRVLAYSGAVARRSFPALYDDEA